MGGLACGAAEFQHQDGEVLAHALGFDEAQGFHHNWASGCTLDRNFVRYHGMKIRDCTRTTILQHSPPTRLSAVGYSSVRVLPFDAKRSSLAPSLLKPDQVLSGEKAIARYSRASAPKSIVIVIAAEIGADRS